jgi:glycosyltransferase involved in cell wall biosynthesis
VAVITPRFGEILQQQGVDPSRVVVAPNFTHIAPAHLDREEARRLLGWSADVLRVVHTGNIGMKQGLEGVVEAARRADALDLPLEFVLVGDGNQREAVRAQAAGTERLVMVPPVDAELYPVVLAAADVLLLHERPGVREMSLPSKLTSYAVSGRPILAACEPGGISHQVLCDARAALVVPPGDPRALVDGALELGRDEALRGELVSAARRLAAEQYGAEAAAGRYVALVPELLR